ncbi:unnamed protein product [Callosobruchus maculatus]|uniref:Uncharacterized protein n=1 Tax=Callosobruchus maculatus TaxID=64391 RepID=A0A653BN66_CALMS|nr:unnamed protein product [Callosobruchus maculatus]
MHQHHTAITSEAHEIRGGRRTSQWLWQTNEKRGANAGRIGCDREARTPIASRSLKVPGEIFYAGEIQQGRVQELYCWVFENMFNRLLVCIVTSFLFHFEER